MLILEDGALVYSATDMADAATCEFALLRTLDAKLARIDPLEREVDATRERAGRLGDAHEQRVLADFVERHGAFDAETGRGVLQIERPRRATRDSLTAKHTETLEALRTGADVIFQAGFFDGRFGGWADFLVREGRHTGGRPRYTVKDTKLARREKPTALIQIAAYADQMLAGGIDVTEYVHLILGNRVETKHKLSDLLPVYRERRWRLEELLFGHMADVAPVEWGDARYRACGRCDVCLPELEARRSVLLVAGVRVTQLPRLAKANVHTVEELAQHEGPVEGIGATTLDKLRAQAKLQARQEAAGASEVAFDLFDPKAVASLPAPSPGDIFFDFEGDPLWAAGELDGNGQPAVWGLEYLFGSVEALKPGQEEPAFVPFWAHDRAEEKQALVDFLEYVRVRREEHPDMHIYHYAPYERTALLRLAGRHGVGEVAVDELLSSGVLVDLYATVRASLRTGQRSYSLKKLEPLYMDDARTGAVVTAGDSINEYAIACELRERGDYAGWEEHIAAIGQYNEYDCVSTLRLRDWLLEQAALKGFTPGIIGEDEGQGADEPERESKAPERDALIAELNEYANDEARFVDEHRTAEQQAIALLAASLGYHWREHKPFWWAHYARLSADPAEWTDARSTFVAEDVEVVEDWHVPVGLRTLRRHLRLTGRLEPGSELRAEAPCWALYDPPGPEFAKTGDAGGRSWTTGLTVLSVSVEGVGDATRDVLVIEEALRKVDGPHTFVPMGLGPTEPPSTAGIADALHELGQSIADKLPTIAPQPALDLVRRVEPRTMSGNKLPVPGDGPDAMIVAITAALRDLDGSYLAVQGPPGTGKTYTGSHVIANLVAAGWKVGVVAQSHAVVENLLTKVIEAGVAPEHVAKKYRGKKPDPDVAWAQLKDTGAFESYYASQDTGFVVGGTMWDFTSARRIPPGRFDLLVIDEAGQFSLANTFAVSAAARNLLLLGDPQQLPQVSQGIHPEPVDASALGWLTDGHDTLPQELGYFLAHTWRMHPDLCGPVSRLSYEGRLESVPRAAQRFIEGVPSGVRSVFVEHTNRAVSSPEEAAQIVAEVQAVLGARWVDPAAGVDRPLEGSDVLVVAAYNAQVWTIKKALETAGITGVKVGTVDKFQGQEAPIVFVSMAASAPEDVPRGMEFLLNRNRLNVAVSRGQWAAVIVRSSRLTDYLPTTPAHMAELGAFIGLCGPRDGAQKQN